MTLLSNATGTIQNRRVRITRGVPQGAVLSPTLFNVFLNPLLEELDEIGIDFLAFADDIVLTTTGTLQTSQAISVIERWCLNAGISINKNKSAVMVVRQDRRTPDYHHSHVKGIPVVTHYKYLGVHIDDALQYRITMQSITDKLTRFRSQIKLTWASKIPKTL